MVARSYYAIKKDIDILREGIGRTIHIFTPTRNPCSICTSGGYYDPLNDKSVFIKCPECAGAFWRADLLDHVVLARVHWTTNEVQNITPGGTYFTGDAYAVIDPEFHSLAQEAQEFGGKVTIDGQDMTIIKISPEGAQSTNRYKLILKGTGKRPS